MNFMHEHLRHLITMFFLIYEVNLIILLGNATFLLLCDNIFTIVMILMSK